jgi:hypothetical protein
LRASVADNKTLVLTDVAAKDVVITLGDKLVANRADKESKSDLRPANAFDPRVGEDGQS